jgi:2-polyprenyl-3-methyl-5-hydroxy-6-metoxy-1,4-benzoquinol methylase
MSVTRTPCPVCEADRWSVDDLATRILALPETHAIVVCAECGQRRLEPQLTDAELDDLYSGAYFSSSQAVSMSLPRVEAPPNDYSRDVVGDRRKKFEQTLAKIKKQHPSARRLLDVGAATGELVRMARDFGFEADGIEMSQFAVSQAQEINGVTLERNTLAGVLRSDYYDCIHLNHVFEHFNEPLTELRHIGRLLREGGLLYIEVPYQFQIIEKLLFRVRRTTPALTLHSLHHAYFYTPDTLARVLSANGFEILSVSVFDPERYPVTDAKGRLKKLLWRVLAYGSIGNHIELFARRLRRDA